MFQIQLNMAACERRHMSISVSGTLLVCKPPSTSISKQKRFHRLKKTGFYLDSGNTRNHSNHHMGNLWIQTYYNMDENCPDHCQPVTINIYGQSMISLESCSIQYGRVWLACFVWEVDTVSNCNVIFLQKLTPLIW